MGRHLAAIYTWGGTLQLYTRGAAPCSSSSPQCHRWNSSSNPLPCASHANIFHVILLTALCGGRPRTHTVTQSHQSWRTTHTVTQPHSHTNTHSHTGGGGRIESLLRLAKFTESMPSRRHSRNAFGRNSVSHGTLCQPWHTVNALLTIMCDPNETLPTAAALPNHSRATEQRGRSSERCAYH